MSTARKLQPPADLTPAPSLGDLRGWKLEDAKARFSEVVRTAREQGPQRVTVHGRDAVVILDATAYSRLLPSGAHSSLAQLLAGSPLRDLDLDRDPTLGPVREVEL